MMSTTIWTALYRKTGKEILKVNARMSHHPLISFPNTLNVFLSGGDPPATDRGLSGMNLGGTVLAVAAGRKTAGGGRRLVSGGSVRVSEGAFVVRILKKNRGISRSDRKQPELIGSFKLGNVLVLVQLIHSHRPTIGPTISCTKTQTLSDLRLPISSANNSNDL